MKHKNALYRLLGFLLVFSAIALIVTSSFLMMFHLIEWNGAQVKKAAPIVFINVIILTLVMMGIDTIRRKNTEEKYANEIKTVLQQLMNGDLQARVKVRETEIAYGQYLEIAQNINRLGEELAGLETLRDDFIANVSHELKTPLAVLQNYGIMLQQQNLSETERMEYAKAIAFTSRKLADLVSNILQLSKLENQQIFPTVTRMNLSEQLCEDLLQYENEWEKKKITVCTQIPEDIYISASRELLSIVWNNLLSNAFKFTNAGGKVSVHLSQDAQFVTVEISDSGCGIHPETGGRIFEKFYQGDTSHKSLGNGLGLALVKRVIDILQGQITVASVYGEGSTFTVRLPKEM